MLRLNQDKIKEYQQNNEMALPWLCILEENINLFEIKCLFISLNTFVYQAG